MTQKTKKQIKTSSGFYCSKKCPFWMPNGFWEYCTAYKKELVFTHTKDLSRRCAECVLDYPTKMKDKEKMVGY